MATKSKFVTELLKQLEGEENLEKKASRAQAKAEAKVKTQIAQLEGKRVELQASIDDASEDVESAKFTVDFNLATYDNVCESLEELEAELEAVEKTIENRKALLESWA